MKRITIYDTTLRDGTQAEDITFSVEDKLRITGRLDDLGVGYIEGGWPGSNPRDAQYFKSMKDVRLRHATLVAFGSTRRAGQVCSKDANLRAILKSGAPAATVVGKAWDFHVLHAIETTLKEHLSAIYETIAYLKGRLDTVIFDAEHFFDGWRANREFAMQAIVAAQDAGADCICLCDTNGGIMPQDVARTVRDAVKKTSAPIGIHCHNDSGTGVAATIAAVIEGARQVQGTINGLGERSGNADLCSIIPNLQLKLEFHCIPGANLSKLKSISRFVYEMTNLPPPKHQPFVGDSAFAHKGGIHVSAVKKHRRTYEHISPEAVGNVRRILISDLAGRSNIEEKARKYGLKVKSRDPEAKAILDQVKDLENRGYQFEGAEASFELLMRKAFGRRKSFFKLHGFRVIDEKRSGESEPYVEATIMVEVGGKIAHTAAIGNGPVNALDNALRKALERFYPSLQDVGLVDYKVRVLPAGAGTASQVRVLIESTDGVDKWGTVGVSENIIEASYEALVDSVDYKLYKDEKRKRAKSARRKKKRK